MTRASPPSEFEGDRDVDAVLASSCWSRASALPGQPVAFRNLTERQLEWISRCASRPVAASHRRIFHPGDHAPDVPTNGLKPCSLRIRTNCKEAWRWTSRSSRGPARDAARWSLRFQWQYGRFRLVGGAEQVSQHGEAGDFSGSPPCPRHPQGPADGQAIRSIHTAVAHGRPTGHTAGRAGQAPGGEYLEPA